MAANLQSWCPIGQFTIMVPQWPIYNHGGQFAIMLASLQSWCLFSIVVVRFQAVVPSLHSYWPLCNHGGKFAIMVTLAIMVASFQSW